ncbi:hypothetical protein EG327_011245, partial [Venturia inaequalis]
MLKGEQCFKVSEELYTSIKELIVLKGKLPAMGSTNNNPGAIARVTKKAREIIAYADTIVAKGRTRAKDKVLRREAKRTRKINEIESDEEEFQSPNK